MQTFTKLQYLMCHTKGLQNQKYATRYKKKKSAYCSSPTTDKKACYDFGDNWSKSGIFDGM